MDVNRKLIFTRYLDLEEGGEPILIRFEYDKLRKFCRRCGSLTHDNSVFHEIIVQHVLPIVEFPVPVNQHPPDLDNEEMGEFMEHNEEDEYD